MRAVIVEQPGGPEVLRVGELPDPAPEPGRVVIRVAAAGVNRADLLQRMGFYPPPPGAPATLGLEVSGVVEAIGSGVSEWRAGDRVMALIEGGGYAELAAAAAAQVVRVPDSLDLVTAGGVPEVFITAHDNLVTRAAARPGETVLIHGGAGGVGTAAIQLARTLGCRVVATAGSARKLQACIELGAAVAVDHGTDDFVARVRDATGGRGADVILDVMGASYLQRNIDALAPDGRLVSIGLQGGTQAELDLALLHRKRGAVIATQLRARPKEQKAAIVAAFRNGVLPLLASGTLRPVIDRVLPLEQAADAHRALESGDVIGKVVLAVGDAR